MGDIFEFSINGKNYSYGQIVRMHSKESITIIIYEGQFNERPHLDNLVRNDILFFGNTFDAKLHHRHWDIIGNIQSNIPSIKFPYYKIGTDPIYVEDFDGNRIREANKEEIMKLIYRPYVAPIRFELALKAHYKLLGWKDEFNDLLYSKAVESFKVIES